MRESPGRYHVSLYLDGTRVLDGWWNSADVAEGKFAGLRVEHGEREGTHLSLTEWDDGQEWPLDEWLSG